MYIQSVYTQYIYIYIYIIVVIIPEDGELERQGELLLDLGRVEWGSDRVDLHLDRGRIRKRVHRRVEHPPDPEHNAQREADDDEQPVTKDEIDDPI